MFRGAHILTLDPKGRLAIPSRFRKLLTAQNNGQLVVTVNHTKEKCLWMYPLNQWELVEQKVSALPEFHPEHQKLKRFLIGYASDVEIDKSGRVLVPTPLREFANLNKEIYLVGQGNKFELWDEKLWTQHCEKWCDAELESGQLSPQMAQLSL